MSATTTTAVVVPPEKVECIQNIFDGMVKIFGLLAMSRDGVRDGIAFRHVFKKDTMEAQELCLAAGVLVSEGWLTIVTVQGRLKGFIRKYPAPDAPVLPKNVIVFPRGKCEKESARVTPGVVLPLRSR
jgi:hypothetical protein